MALALPDHVARIDVAADVDDDSDALHYGNYIQSTYVRFPSHGLIVENGKELALYVIQAAL